MAGAQALAGFAVEIFVEQYQVPPMRVGGPARIVAMAGAAAAVVGKKNTRQPSRQLAVNLVQCQPYSGTGGTLDFEMVAVEVVIALQRLDQEVIGWKPDRPAPVRVAAEKRGVRFPGTYSSRF